MARAIKLSGIPVWYTQGFNPRIYMTFAMPLSLGVSGERECADIRLMEEVDLNQAARRLTECVPEDIGILEITEPRLGFDEIAYGEYEIRLNTEKPQHFAAEITSMLDGEAVTVMKHGKKGDKALDIKPYFINFSQQMTQNALILTGKLPCSTNGSINPGLLLEALKTLRGLDVYAEICRKRLLTKEFSDMR